VSAAAAAQPGGAKATAAVGLLGAARKLARKMNGQDDAVDDGEGARPAAGATGLAPAGLHTT
jgi:hypothetical protein